MPKGYTKPLDGITMDGFRKAAEKYKEGKTYQIYWRKKIQLYDNDSGDKYVQAKLIKKYPTYIHFRDQETGISKCYSYQELPEVIKGDS